MLRSYLRTAFRVFWRHKGFSFLNIAGLSVGLACSFLIIIWITNELSFDRFHENGEQLHNVMRNAHFTDGQTFTWSSVPKPLADVLQKDYPEVEHVSLITWQRRLVFDHDGQTSREEGYNVGSDFLEMFSFPLLEGDPTTALREPSSVVISRGLAEKYFGSDWRVTNSVIGQTFRVDDRREFTITGVAEKAPAHSSLRFDYLLPIEDFIQENDWVEDWGNSGLRILVQLREGTDVAAFNAKIETLIEDHNEHTDAEIFLRPYADQRLYSDYENGRLVGGRIEYVRMFAVVALFVILIACINFMNLATARSMRRAREIGVRKAVGAGRGAIARQFFGEASLLVFFAFVVALGLVACTLPAFNTLTQSEIALVDLGGAAAAAFVALGFLTAFIAGTYPALFLSSFSVIRVLRGSMRLSAGSATLRKGLVVFQFAMSILLIIGAVTVYRQIQFIQTKNLGLDRANLVYMPLEGGIRDQYDTVRQELERMPGVQIVTASSGNPLSIGQSTTSPVWEGKEPESDLLFHVISGDYEFLDAMKMRVTDGRRFERALASDTSNYILNQKAVEAMGLKDPVGQPLAMWGTDGTIVGVVEDFHMSSLHSEIEPTIIRLRPEDTRLLVVRLETGRTQEGLRSLEEIYARFNPGFPFEYDFMDDQFKETYRSEIVIGKLANYFTILAVFIACLGLFGLASYTTEQRSKEIGIRKALGATVANLVLLLSKDLVKLVLVAFVITAPLAYLLMQNWLEKFAYHVRLGVPVLLMAGVAAVLVAWLTVSYQSLRAATVSPVKSLRTD